MKLSGTVNCLLTGVMAMTLGIAVSANAQETSEANAQIPNSSSDPQSSSDASESVNMSADLSSRTDKELTALTAQWSQLSPSERRHLLAEVRGRMAATQSARRITRGRLTGITVQRQYGRVVRKPDGTVVMQTRVVQMTPRIVSKGSEQRGRVTFGIGFEQRSKGREHSATNVGQTPSTSAPTTTSPETLSVSGESSVSPTPP